MFIPLKDDNPLHMIRFQYVTLSVIVLNVLVFLVTGPLRGDEALMATVTGFGLVPIELLQGPQNLSTGFDPVSEPWTLLSYMFLHAGWLHLLGNMAFLWVFADNVEDAFGYVGFAIFYVLCGVGAGLTHVLMQSNSHAPLVGASGAMSGVLAAYLLLYPKARIWILLFMRLPLKIPAWIILGGWLILQFVSLALEAPDAVAIAWWSHIGGFATGLILTVLFRSPLLIRSNPSH
jgi:membrane associated rhomboid family serine protease